MAATFYTEGRPAWFGVSGGLRTPFIIGVSGGTASGKTTLCRTIIEKLGLKWVVLLSMDSFYKPLPPGTDPATFNFDHPDAFDFDLMLETLHSLRNSQATEVPVYDFVTNSRTHFKHIYGADVILVEGLLTLYHPKIREMLDLKIFVDTDADLRLCRRIRRDIKERGRELDGILARYDEFVKPAYESYISPTSQYADIILPFGTYNEVGVDVVIQNIRTMLEKRGLDFRDSLVKQQSHAEALPPLCFVMPSNNQIKALHTIIRNRATNRADFIFYSDRLMRLLIEYGLNILSSACVKSSSRSTGMATVAAQSSAAGTLSHDFSSPAKSLRVQTLEAATTSSMSSSSSSSAFSPGLPSSSLSGETPSKAKRKNLLSGFAVWPRVCGVSVMRAGEAMEGALADVVKDIRIGKLLIQQDHELGQPRLFYASLPRDIATRHVLLCDPITGTGAAAIMAIRVILDHGVPEENVLFLCLIGTPISVRSIAYAFPKVKIVLSEMDNEIDENYYVLPGLGNFGARYFDA